MSTALKPARANDQPVELLNPMVHQAGDGLPSMDEFFEPVRRFWWVIVLAVIGSVAAGTILTRFMPKEYAAEATLIIGAEAPRFLGDEEADVRLEQRPRTRFEIAQNLETQLHVIVSRPVTERVVKKLGLAQDDEFLGMGPGYVAHA